MAQFFANCKTLMAKLIESNAKDAEAAAQIVRDSKVKA